MNYKGKWIFPAIVVLAAILFFSLNIVNNLLFYGAKLDLTSENLYTLSEGTVKVVEKIEEPLTLRFFYSHEMANGLPVIQSYAHRVKALLEQYASLSDGQITLQVVDPEPFSEEEDLAVSYGLTGAQIDQTGSALYLGLAVTDTTDTIKTIPFLHLSREKFLEYDITRIIYELSHPNKSTIGILSSIPMSAPRLSGAERVGGSDWAILEQMQGVFDVHMINPESGVIPGSVDVLMLVHPKGFSDAMMYAVDQYILSGGRAIMFVDPHAEGSGATDSSIIDTDKMLKSWGIKITPFHVVGDRKNARRISTGSVGESSGVFDYIAWMDLPKENFSSEDVITGELNLISMASAGSIERAEGMDVNIDPLIKSSMESMLVDVNNVSYMPNPKYLLTQFAPTGEEYILAARVSGKVKSAFPKGKPKNSKVNTKQLKVSKEDANLIVVADVDILRDRFWVQAQNFLGYRLIVPQADNGAFIINALDNLSGSDDLISLRSRGISQRGFDVVEQLQREAEERYLTKEEELQRQLMVTEQRLKSLQEQSDGVNQLIYSAKQQVEIDRFRQDMVRIRKELRKVQHELQKDIEGLGSILKLINIALVPFLICVVAIFVFIRRGKMASGRRIVG